MPCIVVNSFMAFPIYQALPVNAALLSQISQKAGIGVPSLQVMILKPRDIQWLV